MCGGCIYSMELNLFHCNINAYRIITYSNHSNQINVQQISTKLKSNILSDVMNWGTCLSSVVGGVFFTYNVISWWERRKRKNTPCMQRICCWLRLLLWATFDIYLYRQQLRMQCFALQNTYLERVRWDNKRFNNLNIKLNG